MNSIGELIQLILIVGFSIIFIDLFPSLNFWEGLFLLLAILFVLLKLKEFVVRKTNFEMKFFQKKINPFVWWLVYLSVVFTLFLLFDR